MTLFPVVLLVSVGWAQPNSNGAPSKAVQQEQKQADYARKQHPDPRKPSPAVQQQRKQAEKARKQHQDARK
jgi:hypothetical protein